MSKGQEPWQIINNNTTPNIAADGNTSILTPMTESSPLKRKSQPDKRAIFNDEMEKRRSAANSAQQRGLAGQVNGVEATSPQQANRTVQKPRNAKDKDEITVSQRLMMVTLPRSSLSVDESDAGYSEENETTDEDSDDAEDLKIETYVAIDEDSRDEGDVELEDGLKSKEIEVKVGHLEEGDKNLQHAERKLQTSSISRERQIVANSEDRIPQKRTPSEQDHSWRPRKPRSSTVLMEVDEDITDSPHTSRPPIKPSRGLSNFSRRASTIGSQSLTMARSRKPSLIIEQPLKSQNSQGSIELGDTQNFARQSDPSCVSETQPDFERLETVEDRSSQQSYVPEASYFE
jgi:hypothetical protein